MSGSQRQDIRGVGLRDARVHKIIDLKRIWPCMPDCHKVVCGLPARQAPAVCLLAKRAGSPLSVHRSSQCFSSLNKKVNKVPFLGWTVSLGAWTECCQKRTGTL